MCFQLGPIIVYVRLRKNYFVYQDNSERYCCKYDDVKLTAIVFVQSTAGA